MPTQRSILAFEQGREGTQRFEYFLLGVSVALCTYIGQTLQPQRLAFSPYTVEVGALLLLIASVVVGFKRVEALILVAQLNHDVLHYGEMRGTLMQARGTTWINTESGDVYSPEQTEKTLNEINQALPRPSEATGEDEQNGAKVLQAAEFVISCRLHHPTAVENFSSVLPPTLTLLDWLKLISLALGTRRRDLGERRSSEMLDVATGGAAPS